MPIIRKLSKHAYDRLGHEVVDELADWFNSVESAYRADLRELNESNFARFDAKLEQRFAEQDARIDRRFAEQDVKFEKRFAEQDAKMEKRFAEQDAKMEKRFAEQDAKMERGFSAVDLRMSQLETAVERALKEHTRWMFVAWASLLIPIIGLWMRP